MLSCTLLLGVSFTTVLVEAQQCYSYMGGESSSVISSGGVHRYSCCDGYSGTIQGGGSNVPYCGDDGRPKPQYQHHRQIASFSCSNVQSCQRDANNNYFGVQHGVPGLCWFYTDNFQDCCQPGQRKKRQTDDSDIQYDDKICSGNHNGK